MRKGDVINGYRILKDFSTAGGGLSKWSFAARGGHEYFIKEFLAPTFPTRTAPGSETTKREKRVRCEAFERHHHALQDAVAPSCSGGGNLIFTIDFFREGAKYYKVTEKVDVSGMTVPDIAALPLSRKILILKTVAHSLNILHSLNIVHGDLKPDNILIKETTDGFFTAKLIDFDNSFFSGLPPEAAEEVVGDMVFHSPELAAHILRQDGGLGERVQTASDAFALGLIYSQYLTGRLPFYDTARFQYACTSVSSGAPAVVDGSAIPEQLAALVDSMLLLAPEGRPSIKQVFLDLKTIEKSPEFDNAGKIRLGGSLMRDGRPTDAAVAVPEPVRAAPPAIENPPTASKLRGSLIKRS